MRKFIWTLTLALLMLALPAHGAWDFSRSSIDTDQILSGGPPKDGIPALFDPEFLTAAEADDLLAADERVLGFSVGGQARAYPIRILSWHELVNDTVAGTPVLVSW